MIVDLRSDTVTRPSPEMYEAMMSAPLGDDVLGDEPTVAKLEALAAEMAGHEAGLFVPSGTMSNQIALACHCEPGDAILIEEDAHILFYEVGAPALIAGVVSWTLPSNRGAMEINVIEKRIQKRNLHTPGTRLLCVENTHNRAGGAILRPDRMRAYRELVDRHGMKLHVDGARIFNASTALGVDVKELTAPAHSVSICLSKGLRSPVGSVLCGDHEFIERARIWRKRLGGGMRQAGILAACGIVSLTQMVERLPEDHARARRLAETVNELPGLTVDLDSVETNMVMVDSGKSAAHWQAAMEGEGVRFFPVGPNRFRLVFHADVNDEMTDHAASAFARVAPEML